MQPYWQSDDGRIVLYHGDCREILPSLKADVILTDPPWEMRSKAIMRGNEDALALWRQVAPLLSARRLVLWLPIHSDPRAWLSPLDGWPYLRAVYIRRAIPGYYGRVLLDGEMVHVLGEWPQRREGRKVIPGGMQITYRANDRDNGHPGPRSLIATRWLVHWWSEPGDLILDPFAGSGTTLLAAAQLGRQAVGIEIEERFCEIAARRLESELRQTRLPLGGGL